MKHVIIFLAAVLFLSPEAIAQSDIEKFVKEGIQYHDKGEYEKAIETYEKALELNPESSLVNYEIALSYFEKGDYKAALQYSDVVLKQNKDHMLPAYIIKGSALDMLGKTKESIKLFNKAIKKSGEHFLLYYNLGLNYYKINELDNAEENIIKAIELNPSHSSSHLILASIHNEKGNTIQTLLASHYFLLLEPNSQRSPEGYAILQKRFGGNVTKDENEVKTINIMLSSNDDSQMGAAELMVSMLEASKSLDENKGKTDDEMFVQNTEKFFKILGELREKKNKEIWWNFYTPLFYEIAKSEHLEAYCKYITQSGNENSKKWLLENPDQLKAFGDWLKKN
ncbi:tetratricopeptide repeat protein [Mangrovivirga sp. M17]|uniref:Tetratricopeptide repeat protein n=1 Tax=Mangrovivirga halotolerans TaxID=2993936 RepID=A0ABT3RU55_9BACT|nr:tetratricopeptide repeat protein [Mangrovivirga halotolerans]MCX2745313.1 tetratricopeptide repeat protein [Mangrovivirga halotolerans]